MAPKKNKHAGKEEEEKKKPKQQTTLKRHGFHRKAIIKKNDGSKVTAA